LKKSIAKFRTITLPDMCHRVQGVGGYPSLDGMDEFNVAHEAFDNFDRKDQFHE